MEHKEYKRIAEGAAKAVLFVHGIVGTPNHFRDFIGLVPDEISVYNLLLDGHGKGVRDFSRTSMKKWETQVEAAVNELAATHEEIYVAAHSMGTLFAIEQAIKNKSVKKLFLLAVPIKLFIRPQLFINVTKVFFDKISPEDKIALAAKNCYGIERDKNVLKYLGWVPRYLELFSKIRTVQKLLPQLKTPCTAYQSRWDEMVSAGSMGYLRERCSIQVVELEKSTHFYYDPVELVFLRSSFQTFIGAKTDADVMGDVSQNIYG